MRKITNVLNSQGELQAIIVSFDETDDYPLTTTFLTPHQCSQQVGFIVYPKGHQIPAHRHLPIPRVTNDTMEMVLVRKGKCCLELAIEPGQVRKFDLTIGDMAIIGPCEHSYRMEEDTVLLEVKNGPYLGGAEKQGSEKITVNREVLDRLFNSPELSE